MRCRLRAARALIQGQGQVPEVRRQACPPQALGVRHVQFEQGPTWALEPVKLRIMSGCQLRRMPQVNPPRWKLVIGDWKLVITSYHLTNYRYGKTRTCYRFFYSFRSCGQLE